MTYNILPDEIRTQDLGDLKSFKAAVRRDTKLIDGKRVWEPLSYYERLIEKSPGFADWVNLQTEGYTFEQKGAFMTGALIVSMPFFRAEEAKILERELYREDSLE